ncbi:MAG: hypothetical protein NVSMB17_18470 [Candidatus Dormibacteria bacterium]
MALGTCVRVRTADLRTDPIRWLSTVVGLGILVTLAVGLWYATSARQCQGTTLRARSAAAVASGVRPASGCQSGVLDYAGHLWQVAGAMSGVYCATGDRLELQADNRVRYTPAGGEPLLLDRIPGDRRFNPCG